MADEVRAYDPLQRPIVIFCGDSHTYGVYFNKDETLPTAVERASTRDGARGIRAVNLGIPGSASWDVLDQVRQALSIRPRAVAVRCGVNNLSVLPPDEGLGALENLRIVKLCRRTLLNYQMRRQAHSSSALNIGADPKDQIRFVNLEDSNVGMVAVSREGNANILLHKPKTDGVFDGFAPRLQADCRAMIQEAKAAGVSIFFYSYSAADENPFDNITNVVRETVLKEGAPFIECTPAMAAFLAANTPAQPLAAEVHRQNRKQYFQVNDRHPSPVGYAMEAEMLIQAFADSGIVGKNCVKPLDSVMPGSNPHLPVVSALVDAPGSFRIQGFAGDSVTILLGAEGRTIDEKIMIPVDTKEFEKLRAEFSLGELKSKFTEKGEAVLSVPAAVLKRLPSPVFAVAVAGHGSGPSLQRFVSMPLRVNL